MKKLFSLIAFIALIAINSQTSFAQVSGYTFSQTSGSYTEITGGTLVAASTGASGTVALDDVNYTGSGTTIPFTFTYSGVGYTAITINTNGFITFGTTAPPTGTPYTPISGTTAYDGAIASLGRDIRGIFTTTGTRTTGSNVITAVVNTSGCTVGKTLTGTGINAGTTIVSFTANTITMSANASANSSATITIISGEIRTETLGISPNRIFVIQYKNFQKFGTANDCNNFQIRLSESSNSINIIYGVCTTTSTTNGTPQVGLRGATNADFNNRTGTIWASSTAGGTNTVTMSLLNTSLPATGQTYSWLAPYIVGNPSSFSANPVNPTQIDLSWVLNSGNAVMLAWNTTNTFGTPVNGTTYNSGDPITGGGTVLYNGTGTTYNHTPLTPATTYYYKIWSKDGSVIYSTGVTGSATTPCNTVTLFPYNYDFAASLDACWSITQVSGTGNWAMATTMANPTLSPQNGTHFAYFNSYSFSSGTQSRLSSPNLNFSFLSNPRLDFWFSQSSGFNTTADSVAIDVSTNNGASWTTLSKGYQRINYEYPSGGWDLYSVNLNSYAGLSQVMIGIRGVSLFGENIGVDNITVYDGSPLTGTVNVGSTETITSLTGANGLFNQINKNGLSSNLTVNITSDLTETGLYNLKPINTGNYNVTIYPGSASEKLISGNISNGLIRLYGVDGVTIDGSGTFAGTSKYLRFRNESRVSPTILLRQDAKRNTITNCYIEGNDTSTSSLTAGTILFGTTGVNYPDGNDSNTISFCDIRDRSDISSFPIYGILSSGTSTTVGRYNSYNSINNCNIYNFHSNDRATTVSGLSLLGGTSDWIITSNSFYQTNTLTNTFGILYAPILINNSNNNNHTITDNFIGGTATNCGGSALTIAGTVSNSFYGIYQVAHSTTTASLIQNNTVQNINLSTTPIASSTIWFAGILVSSGYSNILNNKVGNETGNGSISLTYDGGAFTTSAYGIAHTGSSLGNINNNKVGSITIGGTTSNTSTFRGIYRLGSSLASTVTINNNLVGSLTTANSIQMISSTRGDVIECIRSSVNPTVTFDGNTVANVSDLSGNATGSSTIGIYYSGSVGVPTITNNTVRDLSEGEELAGTYLLYGIWSTGTSSNQVITGNLVYNLNHTNSNFGATTGILLSAAGNGTISRNRVYNFNTPNASTSSEIDGITLFAGNWLVTNNQVTLTNGEPIDGYNKKLKNNLNFKSDNSSNNKYVSTVYNNSFISLTDNSLNSFNLDSEDEIITSSHPNGLKTSINYKRTNNNFSTSYSANESEMAPVSLVKRFVKHSDLRSINDVSLFGIFDASTGTNNYYYNSIYIGGTATGSSFSTCYIRAASNTVNLKNNLFYLNRTGGFDNFVLSNESATPLTGWTSNYNVFIGPNTANIGEWGAGVPQDISQWRTSSNGDKQTWSSITSDITPAELFSDISTGSLNINTANTEAWIVSGKGIAVTGQSTDYSGDSRFVSVGNGTTDIGSDEFGALSTTTPIATVDNPPGDGDTSTYTLWGRTVLKVVWGSGGSFYPSSLDVYYNSGVNPPNALGGNYSNSHTIVNSNGPVLTGATYDITYYFGDNETYTIGTPGVSTILAKYNTNWEVYHLVQPENNSVLTYNTGTQTYTVAVTGLYDFSTFALTDDGSALPVTMENFDIAVVKRDAVLNWTTTSELNNKGFGIERRVKNATGYSDWKEISFVNGNGNSNERHMYSYKDAKILSGVYQYRLKQVDYNNNSEYYQPTNNSDVIIGKPGSFDVSQNYPNPSNPKSKIDFQMPFDGKVSIKVYDILGQQIASLIDEFKQADFYTVEFDGSNIASGTYFYRIIAEGDNQKFTKTLKMILVK